MKRRFILSSLCCAILSGCTSTNINNWRIASIPGVAKRGTGNRIGVRSIGLPSFMSQTGVPEPGSAYMANTFPNDVWAAPLAAMLQTTMVENLAQRLPSDTVFADGGPIGAAPDQLIEIQVFAFTPNAQGQILLSAQFATRPAKSLNWQFLNFESSAPGGQMAETIVATMSSLWGEAADRLASMLST